MPIHLTLISTVAIGIPSFILALEQTETVTQSGFLKHVLRVALPGALTMVLNMLLIQGISIVLGFDSGMTATYNLIVAGMVSLMVLMRVCNPMNKIRSILFNTENDLYCTACYFYLLQYEVSVGNCSFSVKKTYLESGGRRHLSKSFGSGGGFYFFL